MRGRASTYRLNARLARATWGELSRTAVRGLRSLTEEYGLSVAAGDLQFLEGRWYITHAGLIGIARRRRCCAIRSCLIERLSDPLAARWIFKATVYKSTKSHGFVGFGDADPSNVSLGVRGAEMRVAETRAVNRALRKAYGIGLCSVEELGCSPKAPKPYPESVHINEHHNGNSANNGQPLLRDQLSLLIRQYSLDPALVKAYAADFCGTQTLSGASRHLVQSFISHLALSAKEDRNTLVCKLNSYSQPQEAKP